MLCVRPMPNVNWNLVLVTPAASQFPKPELRFRALGSVWPVALKFFFEKLSRWVKRRCLASAFAFRLGFRFPVRSRTLNCTLHNSRAHVNRTHQVILPVAFGHPCSQDVIALMGRLGRRPQVANLPRPPVAMFGSATTKCVESDYLVI